MNNLSTKAFYALFNVVFYLFMAMAVAIIGLDIARWLKPDFSVTHSFASIQPEDLRNPNPQKFDLTPLSADVKDPYLITNEWKLTFEAPGWPVRLYISALSLIIVGFILLVLFTLRAFVMSLQRNETFTRQNIKRLQRIGVLFLMIEPFRWIAKYFFNQWLISYFSLEVVSRSLAYQLGYALGNGKFVLNWIFVGLIVLVIAEVFKQGLKLKEEVDLTV